MRLEDPRFSAPGKVGRFGPAVAFLPVLAFLLTRFLAPTPAFGQADIPEIHRQPLADLDARQGTVQPTSAQKGIVAGLGADVRWNRFGTPQSLIKYGSYLGTGPGGDAVNAAKGWIRANRALFRLSDEGVNNLQLLNDSKMIGTSGHAVIFRQRFGNLDAAEDGMITVGIKDGKIAYVSSSIAGDGSVPLGPTLTPQAAWREAAAEVGRSVPLTSISKVRPENSWAVFDVAGFSHPQRARLGALPMSRDAVRPVYEVNVLDVNGGLSIAYTSFVDARTGEVLRRVNRNQRLAALAPTATQFMGAYPEPDNDPSTVECGPQHFFTVPGGTLTIDVVASAAIITNDIVLHLFRPDDVEAAAFDSGFSPEAIHYDVQGADAPFVGGANNMWYVLVCAFEPPTIDHQSPFTYEGVATTNDVAAAEVPIEARWKFFANSPLLSGQDTDIRLVGCWIFPGVGCTYDLDVGPAGQNLAARAPWDFEFTANTSTFTTDGNAATTQETWTSPLSPGAYLHQPTSTTRDYADPALVPFDDEWQNDKCNPLFVPVPGRSPLDTYPDLNASIVNLFSGHNRVHDWSYYLGFTEENSNLQKRNFLNTTPDRENDPEIGDVQAAAQTGGAPGFLGRDNANQITLQDGIPGITNQYLFQPIAGAFYAPCTDGDFDGTVFVHEYTHAISNRMVAGPNSGLSGYQAGSMGESWSDLVAIEYLREYNFAVNDGENPLAVGPYVTGNKQLGIRNYAMSPNPLNYSDLGYGTPGPEVHDDGEVWNAANWEVRQLLVNKYNGSFPASNNALQKQCADGIRPADLCPGNRRWIQIVFDAFLLMPSSVDMLDARDAYLAADVMRFGGANQVQLWRGFARRGMGHLAKSNGTADSNPTPDFMSPKEGNMKFTFDVRSLANAPVAAQVFVGDYERNAVPIADTDPSTNLDNVAQFVPGTYSFLVRANGFGHFRFTRAVSGPGLQTLTIKLAPNIASSSQGATATGNAGGVDFNNLIDDTESTFWANTVAPVAGDQVTVDFAGTTAKTVRRVQVSAIQGSRFRALRKFEILTCNGTCLLPTDFSVIFTSPANAFPGVRPRPGAPDLILREFDVPDTPATHVMLRVVTNQCTGGPDFQGEQDNDPVNATDCQAASTNDNEVRAAELQVFSAQSVKP